MTGIRVVGTFVLDAIIKLIKQSLEDAQNINHQLSINGAIPFFVEPYFEGAIFVSFFSCLLN